MAENLQDLKNQINQLKKEIKNLGGETFIDVNKAIDAFGGGVKGAKKLIVDMKKDVDDLRDTFGTISITLKNIVQDLKGTPDYVKETTKSFDKLESLTRKISDHRKNEELLSVKQLKNIQKQTSSEVTRLKENLRYLDKTSDAYKEVNDALNEKNGLLKDINEQVEAELKTEEKIQKTLGVTGGLFKGIAKSLEHIGIESEHFEHINKDLREAAKSGNTFKVLGTGIKSVGSSIKEAFSDPLVQVAALGKLLHGIVEYANEFDHETIKIQRDLGLTKDAAFEMNIELEHAAQHIGRTHKDAVQANADMNAFLGTNVMLSEQQLKDQIALTKNAGLEVDVREGIYKFSQLTGKSQEQIFNSIGKQNKGVLNNKKVLAEVAKTSGQLAAQYKNNPDLIGKAVIQAQKLGMTLEQTKKISQGLLNFEDSISAELEAELLTGQDLNLERARGLALQGDTAGAAAELMKNLGPNGLAKFQSMNVIQQEAYAKALGMSADELGDSLVRQKQINEAEASNGKGLSKRIKELKEAGEIEKAAELEKLVLKGKSVSLAEQELSNSEKQAEAAEQLKQSFNAFMVGPVTKAMDFFNGVMKTIADSKILQALVGGIGLAVTAAGILMVGRSIISAFKSPIGSKSNPSYVIVEGSRGSGGGGLSGRKGRKGRKGRGGKLAAAASVLGGVGLGDMVGDEDGALDSILEGAEDTSSGGTTSASKKASTPRDPKTGRFMKKGTKGMLGKGGKLLKGLKGGIGGLIASIAVDAAADAAKESGNKGLGKGLDVASGALSGAGTGALIGSIIPGVGTAIGGVLGGLIGGGMSYFGGDEPEMAVGGIVSRPTRALIGEAGAEAVIPLDKFYAKLDELISVVKSGGSIYIDGTKIGTAMAVGTYKTQ
jgi:hypothetical protein